MSATSTALRRLSALTGGVFSEPSLDTLPSTLLTPALTSAGEAETKGFDHFAHVKEGPAPLSPSPFSNPSRPSPLPHDPPLTLYPPLPCSPPPIPDVAAPPDEIFNTGIRYRADKDPKKVDLGVGAYRTDEGKPLVLSVVKKAEAIIAKDSSLNKEYLGIDGDPKFVKVARELLFGADSPALIGSRIASAQGISGTGSVRVGLDFIAKFLPKGTTIYVSAPTWGNHITMFQAAGLPYKQYKVKRR